jgi:uncharacterized protein YjiS (DUF1127 family)
MLSVRECHYLGKKQAQNLLNILHMQQDFHMTHYRRKHWFQYRKVCLQLQSLQYHLYKAVANCLDQSNKP